MVKKKQLLVIVLSIIVLALTILLVDGLFFANKRLKVRETILEDNRISESLNDFKIVYFSDVHFNLYVDENRLNHLIEQINKQKPDLVLFGGDLVDYSKNAQLPQEGLSLLIDSLRSIKAPYGKFAVSGTQELSSDYANTTFKSIMTLSEFEIIDDKLMHIYYNQDFINLIGSTSSPVVDQLDPNKLTIAFTHQPKNADLFSAFPVDVMMAGYTHGGQINIPFVSNLFYGNQPYTKKSQNIHQMQLDISSGVGTSRIDVRLFSEGDILVYKLKSLQE